MSDNKGCPAPPSPISVKGSAHNSMAITNIICLALTTVISLILIFMHLKRYSAPKKQRQIIKIILTPVVMGLVSFLSLLSYDVAQYIRPVGDLYEAFALASLFLLFVQFSVPSGTFSQELFDSMAKAAAVDGGIGWARTKWILVFQLPIIEPILFAITAVALAVNEFCDSSLKPRYANLWVTIIRTISTALALLAILRIYSSTKAMMKPRRAFSKLLCFKIIVGLNILQTWIMRLLLERDVLNASEKLTYADLMYGVPATLLSVECVLFAVSFHYAFSSCEYSDKTQQMNFRRASFDAANPADIFRGMWRAILLLFSSQDSGNYVLSDPSLRPFKAPSIPDRPTSTMSNPYAISLSSRRALREQSPPPLWEDTVGLQQGGPERLGGDLFQRDRHMAESRRAVSRSPSPGPQTPKVEGREMV